MIPQRVQLKGFLCYQEEQEIRFDGAATLWMLSGLNGSGKSSIFDAVTYALFGHHRGGGQQALELINKDSDALLVEFDFLLDGKLYRAKRTLRRKHPGRRRPRTQQILRREGGDNGQGKWVPIEGTGQKREFDAWVAEHVGLTYETFTSSVLLLQGKADKLLDSKPEGRREVLAGIVDLDRYERLHKQADEQRKALEWELKGLNNRLEAVPDVEPLELAEASARIRTAEEAREQARAEVERLLGLEAQAPGVGRLAGPAGRRAATLASRRNSCWASGGHRKGRGTAARVARRAAAHAGDRGAAERGPQDGGEDEGVDKAEAETRRRTDDGATRPQAGPRQADLDAGTHRRGCGPAAEASALLRQRSIQLEKLKEFERHEGDLERAARREAAVAGRARRPQCRARESFEALTALAADGAAPGPAGSRGATSCGRRGSAAARRGRSARRSSAKGIQIKAELEKIRPRLQEAEEALRQAADQATETRTVVQQAREPEGAEARWTARRSAAIAARR